MNTWDDSPDRAAPGGHTPLTVWGPGTFSSMNSIIVLDTPFVGLLIAIAAGASGALVTAFYFIRRANEIIAEQQEIIYDLIHAGDDEDDDDDDPETRPLVPYLPSDRKAR